MVECIHCGDDHGEGVDFCPRTGRPVVDIVKRMLGRTLAGRYRLTRSIGQGGMGTIFEAEHTLIGSKVAVKLLHESFAAEREPVERMYREARATGSIGHPNIIRIHDVGETNEGAPFLVMELLEGESLGDHLVRSGPRSIRFTLDVGAQMLSALHAAHRAGIIHRDLKSDNVFLLKTDDGSTKIKILDFGISKNINSDSESLHLTQTGIVLGTPYYMSPEQASGKKDLDHRIDLYSAGVILYECLVGDLPHSGSNYNALLTQIITQDARPFRDARPDVPEQLEAIVLRALARRRGDRWQSAVDFSEALQVVRRSLPFEALNGAPQYRRVSRQTDHHSSTVDVGDELLKPKAETPLSFESDDAAKGRARRPGRALAIGLAGALAAAAAIFLAIRLAAPGTDPGPSVRPPPPAPALAGAAEGRDAGAQALPPPKATEPGPTAAPGEATRPAPDDGGETAAKKARPAAKRRDGSEAERKKATGEVRPASRGEKKPGLDTPMDNPF